MYKLLLTGTATEKNEIDLYSQFKFLNPNIWGSNFQDFADAALMEEDMGGYKIYKPHPKKIKVFMKKASRYIYRVKLDDVADIPQSVDITVYLDMGRKQRRLYTELQEAFLVEHKGKRASIDLSVTGLTRLHQLAGGHLVLENRDVVRFADQPKLWWILDKLEDIGDEKLFIVCRYTDEIDLISEALKLKRYRHVIMRGGMTDADIKKARKQFQKNDKCQVLVGQIQVVKEGNNFQHCCRYTVVYSKSLSSIDIEQVRKRTRRMGQTRKAVYWHLIMKDTIDEDYETIVKTKSVNAEKILYNLTMKRKLKCQRK